MKLSVPDHQKAKGITFSLKPDIFQGLEHRVEQLGYPWTKSSYIASLVMKDLEACGMLPEELSISDSQKAAEYAKKAVSNTKKRKALRKEQEFRTKKESKLS